MSDYDDASRFFNRVLNKQVPDPDSEGDEPVVIELIIHRATKGVEKDARYAERERLAARYGYMWGAYHFARPAEDPIAQADKFLQTVGETIPDKTKPCKALLVLDLEYYKKTKKHLGLTNGARFIQRVKEKTGTYPGLYVGQDYLREQITKLDKNSPEFSVYKQCWLWVPRYASRLPELPPACPWRTWTLWQFTADGVAPAAPVLPGGLPDLNKAELNYYLGSRDRLRRWFDSHAWTYYVPSLSTSVGQPVTLAQSHSDQHVP